MRKWIAEALLTIVLAVLLFGSLHGKMHDLIVESYQSIVVSFVVTLTLIGYFIVRRWRELVFVFQLNEESRGPMADIHFALLRVELRVFKGELINLRSTAGLPLPTGRLDRFVGAFFEVNRGQQYIGVGATLPSQFRRYYPTYLTQQLQLHSRSERPGVADYRVVIASRRAIVEDYLSSRDEARLFFEKQQDAPGGIILMQVDAEIAEEAAKGLHSPQLGIWQFGLTCWFRSPVGSPELHNVSVIETSEVRGLLTEYLVRINENATRMVLGSSGIEFKVRSLDEKRRDEMNINLILDGRR